MGFGGSGIEKEVPFENATTVAQKSEGFGMMHFFIENTWSSHWLYGLEHSRGFRLGPFSSGVGITSATFKWHYLGTVPEVRPLSDTTTLFEKRWSFYTGFSTGIASGTITREGDQIESVSSSGITFGIKNGVDYLLRKNLGMRIEMSFSSTFFQATTLPANMREFSLWYGLFIPL